MNKREWLRSQGFQVGERGRLAPAMLKALENYKPEEEVVEQPQPQIQFVNDVPLRPTRSLVGYSKEGFKISFVLCFACSKHMMYCKCPQGIVAPPSVVTTKEKDVCISVRHIS